MEMHSIEEQENTEWFPLSYSQQNIWNLERVYSGLPMNNICTALKIEGNLNVEYLQTCVKLAYRAFPTLRTRITVRNGKPYQYISEEIPERAEYYDFSGTNEKGIQIWYQSVAREHFVLCDSMLCQMIIFKLSDHSGGILTRVHHIVADAWSHALVTNHIIHNYFQLLKGQETDCQVVPDYKLHIEAEQKYLLSKSYERDKIYWAKQLQDIPPALAKEYQCAHISPVGLRRSYLLPNRLNRLIVAYCEKEKVSPFAVFYMGLAVYLRRIRGQKRFCIGVPTINRLNHREKKTGGMFVNTLPFVNELDIQFTWNEFNEKLKDDWFALLYHQRIPFEDIKRLAAADKEVVPDQLFEIALSYQNGKMDHLRGAHVTLEGRWIYSGYQSETLCIHLSNRDEDGQFVVDYDYLTQIFSENEIEELHHRLVKILKEGLCHPDTPLAELTLLYEEEEEKVVFDFNKTDTWFDRKQTIAQRLKSISRSYPNRAAVIFDNQRVCYETLISQAEQAARNMVFYTGKTEGTVAIMLPRSEKLLVMMCASAFAGYSWLLIDPEQPEERIQELLRDSQAIVCITGTNPGVMRHWEDAEPGICAVNAETLLSAQEDMELPDITADRLAYLVYTSGTTGKPKAVEVEQKSVMNLAGIMTGLYPKGAVLSICNVSFDAFLLESMIALLNGSTIVLASEREMIHPREIGRLITEYDVGFMALTPSRLSAYLKDHDFRHALPHLETIVCGGETMPPDLFFKLRDYTAASLYNQYGPSEATVAVSHTVVNGKGQITIGKPLANCRIYILDENMHPLPVNVAGELYIGGECLAKGYHDRAELTREKFVEDPFVSGQVLYRTGDMGKWTCDGKIVYLGRNDNQVKILGHRIELAEIENVLAGHPLVSQCVASLYGDGENAQLIAYYSAPEQIDPDEILTYGAEYLPRYLLPVCACQVDEMPVTANGKIDYARLPAPDIPDMQENPADETEETLLRIWKKILEREELGVHSDYFLSGGNSLNAVFMLTEVEREFGKTVSVQELYVNSTIRRFGNQLRGSAVKETGAGHFIPRAKCREWYPATPVQTGFFVMHNLDETRRSYNMPGAFLSEKELDEERLEKMFQRMIQEDEQLRTEFTIRDGQIIAVVHEEVPFKLEHIDCAEIKDALTQFVRPFHIGKAPLIRAAVAKDQNNRHYILIDMHHIISDGISSQIILERLKKQYENVEYNLPNLSYTDYAWWIHERQSKEADKNKMYWEDMLPDKIRPVEFPTDRPRPSVFDGRGGRYEFELPEDLDKKLPEFCQKFKVTPYITLLSVFGVMVSSFSGEDSVVIGSPFSGRRHPGLEQMTGVFIHTLPVFISIRQDESYQDYLYRVRDMVFGIMDHQEISLDELMKMRDVEHSRDRNPIYSIMFSLAPSDLKKIRMGDIVLTYLPDDEQAVKVDLHLAAACSEKGHYRLYFEYARSLFDEVTIAYYSRCFIHTLRSVLEHTEKMPEKLELLDPRDRYELLERPNRIRTPYDTTTTDCMMDYMALIYPDKTAVVWGEKQCYTYRQLSERSNVLARRLAERGIGKGDTVAFMIRRSGDMPVIMFGILKAGAAYVPIDPAFPKERILYMLRQAEVKITICGSDIELKEEIQGEILVYQAGKEEISDMVIPAVNGPEDVANVIFTSGSTGKPKGVMMLHKSLSNLAAHLEPLLGDEEQRILCASNCVFDVFTTETILALAKGYSVSVADEEEMMLPWKMAERIQRDEVTILQLTPSRILMCLNDETFRACLRQIKTIILLGEPWTMELKKHLCSLTEAKIYNIYGPTETSVHNCQGEIRNESSIHIGKPIGNCRYYLLDKNQNPVPPTAVGEIYIAGECLSLGYINQKELTDQVFIADRINPGEKMYRTGDIGRMRADGNWQCLGRVDTQLKLNGHRIEPVEIATVMTQSPYVKEAAVVPILKDGMPRFLRGVLVPETGYREAELREYLVQQLPDYMIPSELILLDEMPRNASGKTDLHVLAELNPDRIRRNVDKVSETDIDVIGDAAHCLREIWREVLGKEPLEDVSFFQQGGTSLTAIIILNQYHQKHYEFSINDFYRYPALSEQIRILCGECGQRNVVPVSEKKRQEEKVVPEKVLDEPRRLCGKGPVLLTGATGYFGSYLLKTLLDSGRREIYCLVRGEGNRLAEVMTEYFGQNYWNLHCDQVEVVTGQVTEPCLGLGEETYRRLAGQVEVIYHCAADVRHFAPEKELLHTNVKGTEEIIRFAREANAALMHISTVSVAGEYLIDAPGAKVIYEESDMDIGQNWMENPYAKSKMLAEAEIADAQKEGVNARIFRIGRLVCNSYSGQFQRNKESNAYYRLIRGILEFGMIPESLRETTMEVTYVDAAAKAVCLLSEETGGAYHVFNPNEVSVVQLLGSCKEVRMVSDDEFETALELAGINSESPYIQALVQSWFSGELKPAKIRLSVRKTIEELEHVGFRWPVPETEILRRCFAEGETE